MKKIVSFILTLLLIVGVVSIAAAAETSVGTVSADPASAFSGELVTVPVRISENSGFTNFGIALDYDRDALTLVSIETTDENSPYLCGTLVSTNTQWDPSADANGKDNKAFQAGKTYGYVTCAHGSEVTDNGILFTATFRISEGFTGTAEVTPIINYVRNSSMTITGTALSGQVVTAAAGDFNGDGILMLGDIRSMYLAYRNETALTPAQMASADLDRDGTLTLEDARRAYRLYQQK